MPKRSNDFQALIAFIEEQVKPEGSTVRESAMLREIDSEKEREIDVLIEGKLGQHDVRIAVECRDHKRKQGVTWVEYLAGRYAHLPVDKVVAVSSSGFTESAYARAEKSKIKLLAIEDALAVDWLEEVARYKMGMVVWHVRLLSAEPVPSGEWLPPACWCGTRLVSDWTKGRACRQHVRIRRAHAVPALWVGRPPRVD